jgi:hypothetical protein
VHECFIVVLRTFGDETEQMAGMSDIPSLSECDCSSKTGVQQLGGLNFGKENNKIKVGGVLPYYVQHSRQSWY